MNVFVVADGIPKADRKMMGLFAFDQAKALSKLGHNVFIAAINLRSFKYRRKYGFEKYIRDGITVYEYSLPVGKVPFVIYQSVFQKCLIYILNQAIKENVFPDVVHSHFYDTTYAVAMVKKIYNFKLVSTEHYSGFLNYKLKNRNVLIKRATFSYKYVDRLLAVSQSLADVIENECQKKAYVVPNVVETSIFAPRRQTPVGKVNFISVGRLSPEKNFPLLINAFTSAYKSNNNITLDIYGSGNLQSELNNQIQKLHMDSVIKLRGFADRKVLADTMANSNVFILLSDFETFGVVYIEALAAGLPVIATDCGGPRDFVNSENGILIECKNEKAAAQAILTMSQNYSNYDKEKLHNAVIKNFSSRHVAELLTKHYLEVRDEV